MRQAYGCFRFVSSVVTPSNALCCTAEDVHHPCDEFALSRSGIMADENVKALQTELDYCKNQLENDSVRADALIAYTTEVQVLACDSSSSNMVRTLAPSDTLRMLLSSTSFPSFMHCRSHSLNHMLAITLGSATRVVEVADA